MPKLKVLGQCLCASILALGLSACPGNPCEEVNDIMSSCEGVETNASEVEECSENDAACAECMLDADIDCDNFMGVAFGCFFSGKCVSDEEDNEDE